MATSKVQSDISSSQPNRSINGCRVMAAIAVAPVAVDLRADRPVVLVAADRAVA